MIFLLFRLAVMFSACNGRDVPALQCLVNNYINKNATQVFGDLTSAHAHSAFKAYVAHPSFAHDAPCLGIYGQEVENVVQKPLFKYDVTCINKYAHVACRLHKKTFSFEEKAYVHNIFLSENYGNTIYVLLSYQGDALRNDTKGALKKYVISENYRKIEQKGMYRILGNYIPDYHLIETHNPTYYILFHAQNFIAQFDEPNFKSKKKVVTNARYYTLNQAKTRIAFMGDHTNPIALVYAVESLDTPAHVVDISLRYADVFCLLDDYLIMAQSIAQQKLACLSLKDNSVLFDFTLPISAKKIEINEKENTLRINHGLAMYKTFAIHLPFYAAYQQVYNELRQESSQQNSNNNNNQNN